MGGRRTAQSEGVKMIIKVEEENDCSKFWDHVYDDPEAPEEIKDLLYVCRHQVIIDNRGRAEEVKRWCESTPGFDAGPEHHLCTFCYHLITH